MIVARVQSHPSRRVTRERLLDGLAGIPTEVVETDFDPPNPWLFILPTLTLGYMPRKGQTVAAHLRVLMRVQILDDGCWFYKGRKDDKGYGAVTVYPNMERRAHRVVYEALVGPIPEGLSIDHLCRNRGCVNPEHLEPVTHLENVRRGYWGKNHCKHGHDYDVENTRWWRGRRFCRECDRIRHRVKR